MPRFFTYLVLAILFTKGSILAAPPRTVTVTGLNSERCTDVFRQILPDLIEGNVEAYTGTLSQLRKIMRLAGATPLDQEIGSNSVFKIMATQHGMKLLTQVSENLVGAIDDENALSVCVLHGNCKMGHGSAATHVSTGHAYDIKPLFGGARSELPAAI